MLRHVETVVVSRPSGQGNSSGIEPELESLPIPPRFRWLKRFGVAAVVLIVGLACLRVGWGYAAHRTLQAEVERYHAAGQLVYPEEFDAELDAVAEDRNAAPLLEKAIDAVVATTASGVHFSAFLDAPETFNTNPSAARELLDSNATVFEMARLARARPEVAWSMRLANRCAKVIPGLLTRQRNLTRLLWLSAAYHFRTGNHAEGVELLHDFLASNEAIEAHPSMLSMLTAWACHGLAFSLVEDFGAGLQVGLKDSEAVNNPRTIDRRRVSELIERLLDETRSRDALIRALCGDRAYYLDMLECIDAGTVSGITLRTPTIWSRTVNFVQRPLLDMDVVRMARHYTTLATAATKPNWPTAATEIAANTDSSSVIREFSRPFSGIGLDSTTRSLRIYFKHLAKRRLTAIALAIRLYVVDNGVRPESLEALVPEYLPTLPADPFRTDGASMGYRPNADEPVLYSVGEDGVDNGGRKNLRADGRLDRGRSDLLFYLDGKKRVEADAPSQPSSETVNDDKNGENAERERKQDQQPKG